MSVVKIIKQKTNGGFNNMLKITTYTRQDLESIFNTDRLDSIKRSLERLGYEFTTNGKRGNNLRLTITKTPDAFKMFCINELGISAQADFNILRNFFYYFFCDEEFQQLPVGEMERVMSRDGKGVSRQTISKWIKFLRNKGIIYINEAECLYYVSFTIGDETTVEEITQEQYKLAWRKYWNVRNAGGEWAQAYNAMCKVNGGTVFKKPLIEENVFHTDLIDDLIAVLLDSLEKERKPVKEIV